MPSIFEYISYGEFTKLIVCLSLDIVEYSIVLLLLPIIGDLYDFIGLAVCFYMFRWIGLLAILELIPGFDILPINVFTWLIWMVSRRWEDIVSTMR